MDDNEWFESTQTLLTRDFNGDKKADILLQGGNETYMLKTGPTHELISQISTSSGGTNTISYTLLTDKTANCIYTKDTGTVFPKRDVHLPKYVVSSIISNDGIGNEKNTTFK